MYSREIEGKEFTFGVSGKLIMNTLVMYDRQTGSLWGQIIGEAVQGSMMGTKLEFIPAIHVSWSRWKELHPNTLALVKGHQGDVSRYDNYFMSPRAGIFGETLQDDRLNVKSFVMGVEFEDHAVAYRYSDLMKQPVLNDQVGEWPVLVVFNTEVGAGRVYNRHLEDGRALTFTSIDGLILTDDQSGSIWDGMSGIAIEGPLAGTQLTPVKSTLAFWFGWKDWYPNTRVFGVD